MSEYRYIVVRPFTYGSKRLKIGDVWEPTGGKYDKNIAEGPMVSLQPAAETKPKPSRQSAAKRKANT